MAGKRATLEEYSFAAEGMTGSSCAAALRRVRSLADSAPLGRAFAAIATLTDLSQKVADRLEVADDALASGDEDSAALELARATVLMDKLAAAAAPTAAEVPAPSYLKRRRVHFDL